MTTLHDKLTALTESLSADELTQIDAVAVDAPPDAYPPEVRAKLQAAADQLSPNERNELLDALAGDDVEGFMIKLPRVKEPGPGGEPEGGGGGFDPWHNDLLAIGDPAIPVKIVKSIPNFFG